jgi:hypothetical protein
MDNWDTPSDWSLGLPGPSSNVVINSGDPEVTASFGTVNSIKIGSRGVIDFIDAGANIVASTAGFGAAGVLSGVVSLSGPTLLEFASGRIATISGELWLYSSHSFVADASNTSSNSALTGLRTVAGTLFLDSGARMTTSGALTNTGAIELRGAATLLNIKGPFTNSGFIELYNSKTVRATLDVAGRAGFSTAGTLTGHVSLSHNVLVEFGSGKITTIASGSQLDLDGANAFVADASDTSSNSALTGLRTVAGSLALANGATVTTSGPLTNSGAITLDWSLREGGSLLNIKGTLTNDGRVQIGRSYGVLWADSTLEAAKVVNNGAIGLDGRKAHATLSCGGPFTNDGSVNLSDDTDTIGGAVGGTGDFSLSTSTLEFVNGVASGETVTFGGGVNHLYLDSPSSSTGTIDDFSTAGDSVVAKGFAEAATTLTYTQTGTHSCSWTLTDSTHSAVLDFAGAPYAQSDFAISPSANGNTLIKFV